jgi:hypothetical protein
MKHHFQLDQFNHIAGVHCSSTSIQNIARFDGLDISEAMAFGLGEGVGFVFYRDEKLSPISRFNGRTANFEEKFYAQIGNPIQWQGTWVESLLSDAIQGNRPILAKSFLAHLPYYDPADFPGHSIIVTAINETTQQVEIADSLTNQLQTISIEQFKQAISKHCPPLMRSFSYAKAPVINFKINDRLLRQSIINMANTMLSPPNSLEGLTAMKSAAQDIAEWGNTDDWQWHAKFAYQSIEKRGTGGGAFRFLYADFLIEAAHYLPSIKKLKLAKNYKNIAVKWQQLALTFKEIFIHQHTEKFELAAQQLEDIKEVESNACSAIINHL